MAHLAAWTSTASAGTSTSLSDTSSTQFVSCARLHLEHFVGRRVPCMHRPFAHCRRFNHEDVMKNDIVEAPKGAQLLFQTRYVEMFGVLASEAARRGILVMIACHRINKGAWPGKGLWYDEALNFPEKRVMESWSKIAGQLCEHWNVFAADLQNEPHASSWGKGLASDWNKAAERIGDHVLGLCPRWLIMIEGVGFTPGAPGADDPGAGYWWGENIVGARVAPVRLRDQSKLVCAPMLLKLRSPTPVPHACTCCGVADSPHVYGPSVYMQHYFEAPNFPDNMPAVWNDHFAFAQEELGVSIVIGEIGGDYSGDDRRWQDWAIPYVKERGFGIFYFALNPDSEDTGGLVPKDWSVPEEGSPEADKLKALSELPSTHVFSICSACRPSSEQNSAQASKPAGKPLIGAVDAVLLAAVLLVVGAAGLMRLRKGRRRAATVPTSDGTEEEEEGVVP